MSEESERDEVRAWAMIERDLKLAGLEVLKRHGHTWSSFYELRDRATAQCPDMVKTEFGTVQKIPDKPVQYRFRRSAEDTAPTIQRSRLRLTITEED